MKSDLSSGHQFHIVTYIENSSIIITTQVFVNMIYHEVLL